MDRGAWWTTIHGVEKVRHDFGTEAQPQARMHKGMKSEQP